MKSHFNELEEFLSIDLLDTLSIETVKLLINTDLEANKLRPHILEQRPHHPDVITRFAGGGIHDEN